MSLFNFWQLPWIYEAPASGKENGFLGLNFSELKFLKNNNLMTVYALKNPVCDGY